MPQALGMYATPGLVPSWQFTPIRPPACTRRSRSRCSVIAVLLCLAALPALVQAETLFVTDILRLGLHRASDTSDTPFRTLASGDELEVIERTRFYAQVRTADGQTGWVKASYLVDEKPARAQLAELTAERDTLAQQLGALRSQLDAQDAELQSVRRERDTLQQDARRTAQELEGLRDSNQELAARVSQYRFSVKGHYVLLTALAMGAIGLIAGWWWCDWKNRQRHGGFRI